MQRTRQYIAIFRAAAFSLVLVATVQAAPEPQAQVATQDPTASATGSLVPSPPSEAASEPSPPSPQSAFEQSLASRLAVSRIGVEQLWLPSGAGTFLGLYRPAKAPIPHGGLIVATAPGGIVDALPVHQHIAETAALGGWSVVSIQQVASDQAEAGAVKRINAAIAYLTDLGIQNIVVLSDALGVPAAIECIANNDALKIAGLVVLGQWSEDLKGLTVSILDIAGTRDLRALRAQQVRKTQARNYPRPIESLLIDGAGPKFYGYEDHVAARVRGWLMRAAPGLIVHR